MNTNKLMVAFAAVALIAGTYGALAQQDTAHTTGQGTAPIKGPNANLTFDTSPEDHARIREIFGKERSALKVDHVSFSLSPGTAVPRSVRLVALPQTIIEIQPTWRGDEYFRVGNQIVIVDSQSMEIVAVLDI
jgi:hypothetical protein